MKESEKREREKTEQLTMRENEVEIMNGRGSQTGKSIS